MNYDIYLYESQFLTRAIEEDLGDWSNADAIPDDTLKAINGGLIAKGYRLEHESATCKEYIHPNPKWGLQVSVFNGEIAFSIPYWDDAEAAIAAAAADAKEIAQSTGLACYDPQVDESES